MRLKQHKVNASFNGREHAWLETTAKDFEITVQEVLRRLVEAEILRTKGLQPIGFSAPARGAVKELGREDSNLRSLG